MTPAGWWFGLGCLFFGAFLGVLVMALCVAARNGDEQSRQPERSWIVPAGSDRCLIGGEWTFDRELFSLSYDDRACALICGFTPNQQERIWLGEAMADALNQAHLPLFIGPVSRPNFETNVHDLTGGLR